jgi:hypothetical protein
MRSCHVLPVIGLATISMGLIGVPVAGRAGTLDQAALRGSSATYAPIDAPSYPIATSEPSYAGPSYPGPAYPGASARASYPAARPVAVAPPVAPPRMFTFELGTRYWYSSGRLAKDLFDDPRSSTNLNSRLTYSGLGVGSYEGFGRVNTAFGSYVRGYAGLSGGLNKGVLNDEDFPPALVPYSNTLSQQQGGKLGYGTIDFGQNVVRTDRFSTSLFVGYGYLNETVNAFGCSQLAGNPLVCVPAISPGVLAITEESHWQFARLGIQSELKVLDCLTLSAEVAWLPFTQLTAQDTHWLRLGSGLFDLSGPIPEFGGGSGVQIEALALYKVTDKITLGVGGRYWALETRGSTDFESVIVGVTDAAPQPLNFSTTRYGGFAQGSYKF